MNMTDSIRPRNVLLPASVILGSSLIVSALIASATFYRVRALDATLQVTGSAKQQVKADTVKWTAGFTRTVSETELKSGYAKVAVDLKAVTKFFQDNGVDSKEITISPVFLEPNYQYGYPPSEDGQSRREYTLRQTVEVQSPDVDKVTALAKNVAAITDAGVIFSTQSLEYFYVKLPELRVTLLKDAVRDAEARAKAIAESGGRRVGTLKAASVGVVQVLPVNSVEITDYGTYDTSKIDKEVMVTVRATFGLK